MWLRSLVIVLACAAVTLQEPVKVTVYYESLCPASIRFITQQLYPTWRAFGDKAARYMTMDLVPYGKATQARNESGWQFVCQHGPSECRGNKLQVCGLHALQRTAAEIAILQSKMPTVSDNKTAVSSEEVDDPLPTAANMTAPATPDSTLPVRGVLPLSDNMVPISSTPTPEASTARRRRRDATETTTLPSTTVAGVQNVDEMTKTGEIKMDTVPNSDAVVGNVTDVVNATDVIISPDVSVIKEAAPYVSDYKMGTLEHNADQVATFIFCIMSVSKPEDALEACASGSGLNADTTAAIQTCYNTTQGDDILAAYGDKTQAATPKISLVPFEGHVPQLLFNGIYNAEDETDAFEDLKSVICRKQTSSYLKNKCSKRRFGLQRPGSGFLVPLLAAGAGALGGYALGSRNKNHGSSGNYNPYANQQFQPGQSSYNPYSSGGSHLSPTLHNQHYPGQTYNPYGSAGGQQYPTQNQQYPGQTYPAYGSAGGQQYPTQNQQYPGQTNPAYGGGVGQQYPGQTAPHNPAYGAGVGQQYPGQTNPAYGGGVGQQYPGQTAPHNPAYGAGVGQQYPGQTNPAYGGGVGQQYPGQTAPHNPAYGAGGVQQFPATQNQAYQGQSAPTNQFGSGVAPQKTPYPSQPASNPYYNPSAPVAPPVQSSPVSGAKPPAPGWVAPVSAPAATVKPQAGWAAPTQSPRVTTKKPNLTDKWVSASQRIVTRPPPTQAPQRTSATRKQAPARKRTRKH